jgi:hypothetical protein
MDGQQTTTISRPSHNTTIQGDEKETVAELEPAVRYDNDKPESRGVKAKSSTQK